MTDTPNPDDIPTLAEALEFEPDELDQNRAGRLSLAQQTRLQRRAGCSLIVGALLALGFAGAGFWLVTIDAWTLAVGSFAVAGGLFALNRLGRGATQVETSAGDVATITGEAELEFNEYSTPNGRMKEYVLRIGNEAFVVSREVFAAFEDGDHYTLYYLPAARVLLSAEAGEMRGQVYLDSASDDGVE